MSEGIDYQIMELDVKKTLLSNILGILFIGVIIFYIYTWAILLNEFPTEADKLVATIIFGFSTIKLTAWFINVNLEYRPRKIK